MWTKIYFTDSIIYVQTTQYDYSQKPEEINTVIEIDEDGTAKYHRGTVRTGYYDNESPSGVNASMTRDATLQEVTSAFAQCLINLNERMKKGI